MTMTCVILISDFVILNMNHSYFQCMIRVWVYSLSAYIHILLENSKYRLNRADQSQKSLWDFRSIRAFADKRIYKKKIRYSTPTDIF